MSSVTFARKDYTDALVDWDKVEVVCQGQRAIKAKKETYLPNPNMVPDSDADATKVYKGYVQRAMFFGITGQTLSNLVGTAFKDWPSLTVPPAIDYVGDDIDGAGVSIYQQSQAAVAEVLKKGRCALWVDYPQTDAPASLADQQAGLIRANVILLTAEQITNWRVEQIGGKQVLTLVVIKDTRQVTDGFEQKVQPIYRVLRWDGVYQVETWVEGDKGSEWLLEDVATPLDGSGREWDHIPLYFIGAQNNDDSIDKAPLLDMAELNIKHYQVAADWYNGLFFAGQPQPVITGLPEHWKQDMEQNGVVLGSRAPLLLPQGATFQFVTVGADTALQTELDKLEKRMQAIGARLITPGEAVMTATQARDQNIAQHSVLSLVAENVSEAYTLALADVARYMAAAGDVSYQLSTAYADKSIDAQLLQALVAANTQGKLPDADLFRLMREMGLIDPEKDDDTIREELGSQGSGITLDNVP